MSKIKPNRIKPSLGQFFLLTFGRLKMAPRPPNELHVCQDAQKVNVSELLRWMC